MVKESWKGSVEGMPMIKFHKKLQILKGVLRQWNKETFGHVTQKVKQLEDKVMAAKHGYEQDHTRIEGECTSPKQV